MVCLQELVPVASDKITLALCRDPSHATFELQIHSLQQALLEQEVVCTSLKLVEKELRLRNAHLEAKCLQQQFRIQELEELCALHHVRSDDTHDQYKAVDQADRETVKVGTFCQAVSTTCSTSKSSLTAHFASPGVEDQHTNLQPPTPVSFSENDSGSRLRANVFLEKVSFSTSNEAESPGPEGLASPLLHSKGAMAHSDIGTSNSESQAPCTHTNDIGVASERATLPNSHAGNPKHAIVDLLQSFTAAFRGGKHSQSLEGTNGAAANHQQRPKTRMAFEEVQLTPRVARDIPPVINNAPADCGCRNIPSHHAMSVEPRQLSFSQSNVGACREMDFSTQVRNEVYTVESFEDVGGFGKGTAVESLQSAAPTSSLNGCHDSSSWLLLPVAPMFPSAQVAGSHRINGAQASEPTGAASRTTAQGSPFLTAGAAPNSNVIIASVENSHDTIQGVSDQQAESKHDAVRAKLQAAKPGSQITASVTVIAGTVEPGSYDGMARGWMEYDDGMWSSLNRLSSREGGSCAMEPLQIEDTAMVQQPVRPRRRWPWNHNRHANNDTPTASWPRSSRKRNAPGQSGQTQEQVASSFNFNLFRSFSFPARRTPSSSPVTKPSLHRANSMCVSVTANKHSSPPDFTSVRRVDPAAEIQHSPFQCSVDATTALAADSNGDRCVTAVSTAAQLQMDAPSIVDRCSEAAGGQAQCMLQDMPPCCSFDGAAAVLVHAGPAAEGKTSRASQQVMELPMLQLGSIRKAEIFRNEVNEEMPHASKLTATSHTAATAPAGPITKEEGISQTAPNNMELLDSSATTKQVAQCAETQTHERAQQGEQPLPIQTISSGCATPRTPSSVSTCQSAKPQKSTKEKKYSPKPAKQSPSGPILQELSFLSRRCDSSVSAWSESMEPSVSMMQAPPMPGEIEQVLPDSEQMGQPQHTLPSETSSQAGSSSPGRGSLREIHSHSDRSVPHALQLDCSSSKQCIQLQRVSKTLSNNSVTELSPVPAGENSQTDIVCNADSSDPCAVGATSMVGDAGSSEAHAPDMLLGQEALAEDFKLNVLDTKYEKTASAVEATEQPTGLQPAVAMDTSSLKAGKHEKFEGLGKKSKMISTASEKKQRMPKEASTDRSSVQQVSGADGNKKARRQSSSKKKGGRGNAGRGQGAGMSVVQLELHSMKSTAQKRDGGWCL